jgi:hypothetical protein
MRWGRYGQSWTSVYEYNHLAINDGGGGGIRTHGGLAPTAVFKTAALNHSATPPEAEKIAPALRLL